MIVVTHAPMQEHEDAACSLTLLVDYFEPYF